MSASGRIRELAEQAVSDRYQTIDQLRDKYGGDWPAKSSEAQSLVYAALPLIADAIATLEQPRSTGPNLTGGTNWICHACGYDVNFKGHGPGCAYITLTEALDVS